MQIAARMNVGVGASTLLKSVVRVLTGLAVATSINLIAQKEPGGPPPAPLLASPHVHSNGWFRFDIESPAHAVYSISAGSSLASLTNISVIHGPEEWQVGEVESLTFTDGGAGGARRFYRVSAREVGPTDDWKNQVQFLFDPFMSVDAGFDQYPTRWVKFAILTNDPQRVYFQHSGIYPFHYDFATTRLSEFKGQTRAQFDQVSLYPATQQVILGALLLPGNGEIQEFGVQLAGLEAFPRERVLGVIEAVRAAIVSDGPLKPFYFPAYEQTAAAESYRAFLAERGVEVSDAARWQNGNVVYASGWAMGRVVYLAGSDIATAYREGRLLPSDILITDGVPAEIPYVAGVISLSASTPNSHVALLAASQGIPFVYLADEADRARAMALVGKEAALGAHGNGSFAQFKVFDISPLEPSVKAELASLKATPPLEYTPKGNPTDYTVPVDDATPLDIRTMGGKAANFGYLRREIPTNSPHAIAITFRLWNEFMAQPLPTGVTLGQEIANRLAPFKTYPPNIAQLTTALDEIREMIEDNTTFTAQQEEAIEQALMGFDPRRKIRFRSSTNVEDSETFIGAGLYDSYSGCLADDTDNDATGPSHCDALEDRERGVFRAIRKVYASFYNENAFLERLRREVNEAEVGMAILVHYSVPDETELANGVATVNVRIGGIDSFEVKMVTQKGAVSITNPDGNARPEVVRVSRFGEFDSLFLEDNSTLVPIGATVLEWQAEYKAFLNYFIKVAYAYASSASNNFTLDFEYKKIALADGQTWLSVKQVRRVPEVPGTAATAPYLLIPPTDLCVYQGEYADVFAIHRAKSELQVGARVVKFDTNISASIYNAGTFRIETPLETNVLSGAPNQWPGAAFEKSTEPFELRDTWKIGSGASERTFTLATSSYASELGPQELPIWQLDSLTLYLRVKHATPQLAIDWDGSAIQRTEDDVRLWVCPTADATNRVVRNSSPTAPLGITTIFYWPPPPRGPTAGYTAPLVKWEATTITGLLDEPIRLTGYYSQSYRPGHHNFEEFFIFEPQLEPGMPAATLDQLRAKDVKAIYFNWGGMDSADEVKIIGFDNRLRPFQK